MPKKKFINGPAATYALLPQNGESSSPTLRWIRTDLNGGFEPFTNVQQVDELQPRGRDGVTISDESTAGGSSRQAGPVAESTRKLALAADYDYESHLRVIGSDPNAMYFQSTHTREDAAHWDCVRHGKERGVELMTDVKLDPELAEIEDNLTDVESNLSTDYDPHEYDDFFNSIIGSEATIRQSQECATGGKPRSLKGANSLNRTVGLDTISSDAFTNMMKVYEEATPDYSSHASVCRSGEILNALNNLRLSTEVRKSCVTEEDIGNKLVGTKVDGKRMNHHYTDPYKDACVNSYSKLDCESILSSYSTLDNHPKILGVTVSHSHGQRATATSVGPAHAINSNNTKFSNVVATPIDLDIQQQHLSWRENTIRKGETCEEKKIRKAAVKAGRKEARKQKKSLKRAFKKEQVSQNCILVSNSTPNNASISKLS